MNRQQRRRAAHVGGAPGIGGTIPIPVLSVHDVRRAPPGSTATGEPVPVQFRSAGAMMHREEPSRTILGPVVYGGQVVGMRPGLESWECEPYYYGTVQRYEYGFPLNNGPFAVLGITNIDESARHDWREFQQLKNLIVGAEWEAVEVYPAESRLRDPSNKFYLWCVPKGVFNFGLVGRLVLDTGASAAPQRPFPKG